MHSYFSGLTELFEMFVDRTAGEVYGRGRLSTEETENGNVALIAYGWLKLAEYNEEREAVTVYAGHKALRSSTVSRWLQQVIDVAENRGRDVILSGESPETDSPNTGVTFVRDGYINFGPNRSAVEQSAVDTVVESLAHVRA